MHDKKGLAKVLAGLMVPLLSLFMAFKYGGMYNETRAQRAAIDGLALQVMRTYVHDQAVSLALHHKFDAQLPPTSSNLKDAEVRLAYASESAEIQKVCPNCVLKDDGFKVGALANFNGELSIWTVDDKGVMTHVKEF